MRLLRTSKGTQTQIVGAKTSPTKRTTTRLIINGVIARTLIKIKKRMFHLR